MSYLVGGLSWFISIQEYIQIALNAALALACLALIRHGDYDEGNIGFVGLWLIIIGNVFTIMCIRDKLPPYMTELADIISLLGWALFMARHIYRFLQWRWHGKFDWRKMISKQGGVDATHH